MRGEARRTLRFLHRLHARTMRFWRLLLAESALESSEVDEVEACWLADDGAGSWVDCMAVCRVERCSSAAGAAVPEGARGRERSWRLRGSARRPTELASRSALAAQRAFPRAPRSLQVRVYECIPSTAVHVSQTGEAVTVQRGHRRFTIRGRFLDTLSPLEQRAFAARRPPLHPCALEPATRPPRRDPRRRRRE